MDDEEIELHAKMTGLAVWYVGFAAAMVIGLGVLAAWWRPVWLGFERDARRLATV